jgi:hypothetical protein
MIPVIARIIARYISGALVAYGLTDSGTASQLQPDLALLIGTGLGALTEGFYALAVRFGWTK